MKLYKVRIFVAGNTYENFNVLAKSPNEAEDLAFEEFKKKRPQGTLESITLLDSNPILSKTINTEEL